MLKESYAVSKPYQVLPPTAPVPAPDDVLERLVREGARKMLQAVLEEEVDEFLSRRRYQRTEEHRGYRNGHLPTRTIGVGMGPSRSSCRASAPSLKACDGAECATRGIAGW